MTLSISGVEFNGDFVDSLNESRGRLCFHHRVLFAILKNTYLGIISFNTCQVIAIRQ